MTVAEEEARCARQNDLAPDVVALWGKIHEYEQDILHLRKTVHDMARRLAAIEERIQCRTP